jgi:hypothetical protein
LSGTGLEGHNKKLCVERVNTRSGESICSSVTVPPWSKLSKEVINALALDKTLPAILKQSQKYNVKE